VIHVYALSAAPTISVSPASVNREVLLAAIKDKILASADLHVVHSSGGGNTGRPGPGHAAGIAKPLRTPAGGQSRP